MLISRGELPGVYQRGRIMDLRLRGGLSGALEWSPTGLLTAILNCTPGQRGPSRVLDWSVVSTGVLNWSPGRESLQCAIAVAPDHTNKSRMPLSLAVHRVRSGTAELIVPREVGSPQPTVPLDG